MEVFTILWYCNINDNVLSYNVKLFYAKSMIKEPSADLPEENMNNRKGIDQGAVNNADGAREDDQFAEYIKSENMKKRWAEKILAVTEESKDEVISEINSLSEKDLYAFLEELQELNWKKNILGKEGFPEEITETIIAKVANMFWLENLDREKKDDYLGLMSWLYANSSKYEKILIQNLNFQDYKKYFKTEVFLQFINDFYNSSNEYGFMSRGGETAGGHGTLPRIEDFLKKEIQKKEASYFLLLHAKEVYLNITTKYYEDLMDDEMYVSALKERYGDEWKRKFEEEEKKTEGEFYATEEHAEEQRPFKIAPNVYAIIGDNGEFIVSESKDCREIEKLLAEFSEIADKEMEPSGKGAWTLNDKTYNAAERLKNELSRFFRRKLSMEDLSVKRSRTEEEQAVNEQNYIDYKYLIRKQIREKIEDEFSFKLSDLAFREQFYFLRFIKRKKEKEIGPVKTFVKQYGVNGLKTFLSLDYGEEMGDKILNIGEKLGRENADLIFSRYAEIVDMTEKNKQELSGKLKKEKDISDEDLKKITEQILVKANCLLLNFSDKLEQGEKLDSGAILRELEEYKTDLLLTFSVYKGLKDSIELGDLKDVSFESAPSGRYTPFKDEILKMAAGERFEESDNEIIKEASQMLELYEKNYKNRPELKKTLLENFAKAITKKDGVKLYIIKEKGKIVGFNKYEVVAKDKKHFGSCNVMPAIQNSSVGNALFLESMKEESRGFELNATCDAFSPASAMYIEKGGFTVEKIDTESDPDNIPWFILKRRKDEEGKYYYQGKSAEDIKKEYEKQGAVAEPENLDCFIMKFKQGSSGTREVSADLVNNKNFKITRYFFDKKNKNVYLAFERPPSSSS